MCPRSQGHLVPVPEHRGTILRRDPAVTPEGRNGRQLFQISVWRRPSRVRPQSRGRGGRGGRSGRPSPRSGRRRPHPSLRACPHPCFCGSRSCLVLGPPPPLPYLTNANSRVQQGFPIPKSEWSPRSIFKSCAPLKTAP